MIALYYEFTHCHNNGGASLPARVLSVLISWKIPKIIPVKFIFGEQLYFFCDSSISILIHAFKHFLQRCFLSHELSEGKTTIVVPVHFIKEL